MSNTPSIPPLLPVNISYISPGKPFYLPSIIIAVVGFLPLFIYLIMCITLFDSGYRGGGNPVLIILMGFVGFELHGIGLVCGIIAIYKGGKAQAYIGSIMNALILIAVFVLGFIAFAMA